jgi:hypothetical protein
MALREYFGNILDGAKCNPKFRENALDMLVEMTDYFADCKKFSIDDNLRDQGMELADLRFAVKKGAISNNDEMKTMLSTLDLVRRGKTVT